MSLMEILKRAKDLKAARNKEEEAKATAEAAILFRDLLKGDKGDKGDPLKFEDLNADQKAQLMGKQGPPGRSIKGDKGDKGDRGERGPMGPAPEAIDEKALIEKIRSPLFAWASDTIKGLFTDLSSELEKKIIKIAQSAVKPGGGGTYIAIQDHAPTNPRVNDLWIDTSA